LRTGPLPCKAGKTTGCIILLQLAQAIARAKRRYALPAAQPNIVLPDFTRSFSSDISVLTNILVTVTNEKEAVACQGARPGVWPVKWQRSA